MKTFRLTITLIGCALLLLPVSCSIKEDRSECPCLIHMDYSEVMSDRRLLSSNSPDSLLVIIRGLHSSIERPSEHPEGGRIFVSRTASLLSCYIGMTESRMSFGRNRLVIPVGEDADALFSFHRYLELGPDTEEVFVTPVMCYEHTSVILAFPREDGARDADRRLVVTSSSCGLDLDTGEVIEGEFSCEMRRHGDCSWQFFMPRQARRDVRIEAPGRDGGVMFSVDLASELVKAGYDFQAESLPPVVVVSMSSDFVPTGVRILDWEEYYTLDYIL